MSARPGATVAAPVPYGAPIARAAHPNLLANKPTRDQALRVASPCRGEDVKKTVDGKRFSRREGTYYEGREEVAEHMHAALRRLAPAPFGETVADIVAECRAMLEAEGLPSTATVSDAAGWCELPEHLASLGHKRDSLEDLAARIIVVAERRLPQATGESRDRWAFQLGWLATLARVYGMERAAAAKGGREPDHYRDRLLLARFEELRPTVRTDGRAYEKLAGETGMKPGAVKARLWRMKKVVTKPANVTKT